MEYRGDYERKNAQPPIGAPHDISFLSPEQLAEAERRRDVIVELEAGSKFDAETVGAAAAKFGAGLRQFNRYRRAFRETDKLTSLLPGQSSGGRGKTRKDPRVDEVVAEVRLEYDRYLPAATPGQHYSEVKRRLKKEGIKVCTETIRSRYKGVPLRQREARRYGKKYARERREALKGKTPPTSFPLERVQIDHTLVDVVCTGDHDREYIGRPWVTFAIDEHTRVILAFVLSWEYPNATTVALLLARALTPKEDWLASIDSPVSYPVWGKMDRIFVDNAGELSSAAVVLGCKENNIAPPERRPKGLPHFGGIIERFIGTAMRNMRLLRGQTAERRGFGKERTRNPNETAEMSRLDLERWLLEKICEQYHRKPHKGIGNQAPIKAWERGIYGTERRPGRGLAPVANKTKVFLDFAEVQWRTIQRYGVRWDDAEYWDDVLQPLLDRGSKQRYAFKRNPYDIARIWFKNPEDGEYYELRSRDITLPSISAAEYRVERRRRRAAGDESDAPAIEASIERVRQMEEDARSKTSRHRRRLNAQKREDRRKLVDEVTPYAAPIAPPAPAPTSAQQPEPTDSSRRRAVVFKVAE
ncbi:Mu transposase C-terminal domain-containing protein [Phenylobacterium sp.]|uniref:Mu transposase C-terminal domain-containing protein n=1 Tax=Phenylobacterium sp. TaxID=1871053 RepID=UPI00272FA0C1|nr:Mu transposase C-terminal domain-containing protein [Phenylobacterium sp.]MDP1615983.1 Mu transposase C-terminal domain-containing protein [Phenylobacterium sp.]MDP1986358.1 Mu transposase C-terminal domain-containing protein [Phenylobacterium sp.]